MKKLILICSLSIASVNFCSALAYVCYSTSWGPNCFGSNGNCDYFYSHGCNTNCTCTQLLQYQPIWNRTDFTFGSEKENSVSIKNSEGKIIANLELNDIPEGSVFRIDYIESLNIMCFRFYNGVLLSKISDIKNASPCEFDEALVKEIKISI
ncbi:MAG: hypothetical protein U0T73_06615 [Chitinophagales bacterium]